MISSFPISFFTFQSAPTLRETFAVGSLILPLIYNFIRGADSPCLVMVIPFPLLHKLNVNRRKRWILIGVFSLPIIPIIFAILRLVMTNPKTHNVDPIKFQLFSMLENTFAIVTSCLPAFRLFIVNAHKSTANNDSQPTNRYSRGNSGRYRSFGGSSQNRQDSCIPLGSCNGSYHANVVNDRGGAVGKAMSKDSDEESLCSRSPTATEGILVTRDYRASNTNMMI